MKTVLIILPIVIISILFSMNIYSQDPGSPPPPPSGHGEDSNQNPRNAPVGSGTIILILLGGIYGWKKYHQQKKDFQ